MRNMKESTDKYDCTLWVMVEETEDTWEVVASRHDSKYVLLNEFKAKWINEKDINMFISNSLSVDVKTIPKKDFNGTNNYGNQVWISTARVKAYIDKLRIEQRYHPQDKDNEIISSGRNHLDSTRMKLRSITEEQDRIHDFYEIMDDKDVGMVTTERKRSRIESISSDKKHKTSDQNVFCTVSLVGTTFCINASDHGIYKATLEMCASSLDFFNMDNNMQIHSCEGNVFAKVTVSTNRIQTVFDSQETAEIFYKTMMQKLIENVEKK